MSLFLPGVLTMISDISDTDFDGFITYNGGYCITKEGEVLFKNVLILTM